MAIVSRKDHISFLHNKIGELTSHADFWDTTLICSDGTMCQSKLVGKSATSIVIILKYILLKFVTMFQLDWFSPSFTIHPGLTPRLSQP